MSNPRRTCIGCRKKRAKSDLLRFVALGATGDLSFDLRQREEGRGVYLCAEKHCLAAAIRAKGFARGLRRQVNMPTSAEELLARVVGQLEDGLDEAKRATGLLSSIEISKHRRFLKLVSVLEEKIERLCVTSGNRD